MLCDRFLEIPWADQKEIDQLKEQIEASKAETSPLAKPETLHGLTHDELRHREHAFKRHLDLVKLHRGMIQCVLEGKAMMLTEQSIPFEEQASLKERVRTAQKFSLTLDFVEASLERLATPDTVVKSRDWFHLPHNPMWVEWSGYLKAEQPTHGESYTRGILLEQGEAPGVVMSMVSMIKGVVAVERSRFYPDTLRIEGGKLTIDWEDLLPGQGNNKWELAVTDFIIRINSPRITETRACEDQSAINKKRVKNGKLPLFSYVVVDLNKQVKADLRAVRIGSGDGVRFHWRRGHFKLLSGLRYKEPGLHWWNPHTAGRKAYGEIKKDYVA